VANLPYWLVLDDPDDATDNLHHADLQGSWVQTSNIFSTQIYRTPDKSHYYKGYKALLALVAWNIILFTSAKAYYQWRNKMRHRQWKSMTKDERLHYLNTTTDKGNKRLEFRFKLTFVGSDPRVQLSNKAALRIYKGA